MVGDYLLVPDAYTHITDGETSWPIVWELDRSTESKKQVQRKLEALINFVDGAYRQLFSVDSITIAFVADNANRATRLRIWTEETLTYHKAEVLAQNFLFASFITNSTKLAEVFLSPGWQSPFTSDHVVMLEV
jgi:hypothetical protein